MFPYRKIGCVTVECWKRDRFMDAQWTMHGCCFCPHSRSWYEVLAGLKKEENNGTRNLTVNGHVECTRLTNHVAFVIYLPCLLYMKHQCLSPFVAMPFLGSPLAFTLVYIWSRRNPSIPLNFLGLFVFTAPYLPWVLLGFTLLLNSHFPTGDLMGIAVGHIYYFFEDVWPKELASGGRRYLQTPSIL
jgi:hypothetical protein